MTPPRRHNITDRWMDYIHGSGEGASRLAALAVSIIAALVGLA